MELRRKLRTLGLLTYVAVVVGLLVYSRVRAYSLAPTITPKTLSGLPWFMVPLVFLADYASHAWICLLFAFTAAGLIYEFMPKQAVIRVMSSRSILGYVVAVSLAPMFTVCSCTMIPIFAGIVYAGAGIGPAIAFLLMAPAANVLTLIVTGEFLYWEIVWVRLFASFVTAVLTGLVVSYTPWGRAVDRQASSKSSPAGPVDTAKPPLDVRLLDALKFSGFLAKRIIPFFLVGLLAVSYFEAYMPESVVQLYLTGPLGVLIASVIGGPLYTPTLVEIVIARGLLDLGMSKGALLAWLMGQPYDIPNMMAVSRVVKWQIVATYAVLAFLCSFGFGMLYGVLSGSL